MKYTAATIYRGGDVLGRRGLLSPLRAWHHRAAREGAVRVKSGIGAVEGQAQRLRGDADVGRSEDGYELLVVRIAEGRADRRRADRPGIGTSVLQFGDVCVRGLPRHLPRTLPLYFFCSIAVGANDKEADLLADVHFGPGLWNDGQGDLHHRIGVRLLG